MSILLNKIVYRPYIKLVSGQVGRGFKFGYSSSISRPGMFQFGDKFFCGPNCYFSTNKLSRVVIGSYVMMGPECKVIGGNHNVGWGGGRMMNAPANRDRGITIEDDVWLGCGVMLLDGTYISEGSAIGAAGVVAHFIPPYVIATGVPAKKYRARFGDKELEDLLHKVASKYHLEDIIRLYKKYNVI